jgi:predicted secreted protein
MATSGVFNGTNLILKVIADGGTLATIGHTTSCSISLSNDLPIATTKDSAGWQEVIAGVKSAEITFDGLVDYSDSMDIDTLMGFVINRTKIDFSFGTAETGDVVYSGEGFLSSIDYTAEMESPVSFSGSITSTGAITSATN